MTSAPNRLRPFLASSIVLHLAVFATAPAALRDFGALPEISVSLIPSLLPEYPEGHKGEGFENPSPAPSPQPPPASGRGGEGDRQFAWLGRGVGVREILLQSLNASSSTLADLPPSATNASSDIVSTLAHTPQPESATAEEDTAASTSFAAEIHGRIESELARYFQYPYLARREGWEGAVQLAFRITGGGEISDIRIARSSGYPVLDKAAIEALTKATRIVDWPAGRTTVMELPVYYRLAEAH